MKRLLFIAIVGTLFTTSCSKEYKCRCVSTVGTPETTEFEMAVGRRTDANNRCLQYQRQYNDTYLGLSGYKGYDCSVVE